MNRKWLLPAVAAGVLALAIVIGLVVFMQQNNAPPAPEVVGVCIHDGGSEQEARCAELLTEQLERKGYAVKLLDAGNDQSVQNQQVEALLAQACKALILCPVMPDSSAQLVQQAKEKQVPVLFFGREPAKEILELWDYASYIGCDPSETGKLQAQLIAQLPNSGDVNEDGIVSYILLRDSEECADTALRAQSAVQMLSGSTNVSELNDTCTGSTRGEAKEACAKILANYGKDIEVVLCTNDTVALGALDAIKDGGRTVGEDIYLVGADGSSKAIEKILTGELSGTVLCDMNAQAEKTVQVLTQLLEQPAQQKVNYVNHIVITKENAAEYQQ